MPALTSPAHSIDPAPGALAERAIDAPQPPAHRVTFVDRWSIAHFEWPATARARLAARLLSHYVAHGTGGYIENAEHEVAIALVDDEVTPLVVNHGDGSSCYLTSPYVNYFAYAKDFVLTLEARWLRWLLLAFLWMVGVFVRREHLDRVVYVNHWMLATGPRLALSPAQVERLIAAVTARYPGYALVFKGVREIELRSLRDHRCGSDLRHIFNRQIYLWDGPPRGGQRVTRDFRVDRKLLGSHLRATSRLTTATPDLVDRLFELYRKLYIDKYSTHNALYRPSWFEHLLRDGALQVEAIRTDGRINYFVSWFAVDGEMIGSVVGHDPVVSKEKGLYRAGMSYLMMLAEEQRLVLNLSSGSGRFKLKRGCTPENEYELLWLSTLPRRARLSWLLVRSIYNAAGPKLFSTLAI
jgi:hypothetical protein